MFAESHSSEPGLHGFIGNTGGLLRDPGGDIAISGKIVYLSEKSRAAYSSVAINPKGLAELAFIVGTCFIPGQGTRPKESTPVFSWVDIPESRTTDFTYVPAWLVSEDPAHAEAALAAMYDEASYRMEPDPSTGSAVPRAYAHRLVIRTAGWRLVRADEGLPAGFEPVSQAFLKEHPKLEPNTGIIADIPR